MVIHYLLESIQPKISIKSLMLRKSRHNTENQNQMNNANDRSTVDFDFVLVLTYSKASVEEPFLIFGAIGPK